MIDKKERQANYDLLRIIATVAVIGIHTNWRFFEGSYADYSNDISWIIKSLINIITRFSVPSFVMISGVFNLNKKANAGIKHFYKKTSYKIFLPFVIVLILECLVTVLINQLMHRELNHALKGLFTTSVYNLWYIYMLFGLYLLTPFLVKLKTVLSYKAYKGFAILVLVWAVISQSTSIQIMAYSIGVVGAFLGYYLIGDIIRTEINRVSVDFKKRIIICSLVVSFCAVCATFWVRALGINYYVEKWSNNFFSPTIVIYSVSVFTLFSAINCNTGTNLYWLSKRTFYIYLFHTLILSILSRIITPKIENEFLAIALLVVMTFFVSLLASLCFEKIWGFVCLRLSIEKKWKNMKIWNI